MTLQLRRRALKEKDDWLDECPKYQENDITINGEVRNNANSNDMIGARKSSKSFSDIKTDHSDRQLPFFWALYTSCATIFLILVLCYIAFFEDNHGFSSEYNAKRGMIACALVFIGYGVSQAKDGPIVWPHPAFWRLILCCYMIYELVLIFLFFQTAEVTRQWINRTEQDLGIHFLGNQTDGGNCFIYDYTRMSDPWHNVKYNIDLYLISHFVGYWAVTLMLRSYWLPLLSSLLFEVVELSLKHQLPYFFECWWDRWFIDSIVTNGGGIVVGMLTIQYFNLKKYHWEINNWKKLAAVSAIIFKVLFLQINVFYLEQALWIPIMHNMVKVRCVMEKFMGVMTATELYEFSTSKSNKPLGQFTKVFFATIFTETMIVIRYLWHIVKVPPPLHIVIIWCLIFLITFAYLLKLYCKNKNKKT